MKKYFLVLALGLILALTVTNVSANSPYTTWTMGPGHYLYRTQDAYTPVTEVVLPIRTAEDLFVAPDGYLYIADTGHGLILKLKDFETVATFGKDFLKGPTGIFVDELGTMYVADGGSNTIVIMDQSGNLVKQFGRPSEPLFGKSNEFLPRKLLVDARQNLFIINEGSVNGVVQMNTDGNFIGYFGPNASTMSLKMILQRLFLTQEQLDQMIKNVAASPSNIVKDSRGIIYTVTAGTARIQSIRAFTVSGKNIFPNTFGSNSFRDVYVDDNGLLLAVDANGQIYEYTTTGALLFRFGAKDTGDQRLGLLTNPTAIERFQDQIYVLDKDKNAVVVYQTTAFAKTVHEAVRLYSQGFYDEARPFFEQILNFNGSFVMAYQGIADSYFKDQDFARALPEYKYAESQSGYSNAYWELRNQVLQKYLGSAIILLFGLWIVSGVFTHYEKRYRWLDPARNWLRGLQKFKIIDDLTFMFRFIRHPIDSFYYIKKDQRGSLLFAFIVYIWVIVARVLSLYLTGFTFTRYPNVSHIPIENEVLTTALLLLIWNSANYLVSTISDGEGRVRDVIIGSAYSLFPYALFVLPIAFISKYLTLNEIFIYTFSMNIVWAWTGIMLFIMVMEIHNYSFSETVKNVLITLFTMGMFLLTGYILIILFRQLFDFVLAIVQEIGLRG
jgi:tetratricopeptide (TPR) repeat protein